MKFWNKICLFLLVAVLVNSASRKSKQIGSSSSGPRPNKLLFPTAKPVNPNKLTPNPSVGLPKSPSPKIKDPAMAGLPNPAGIKASPDMASPASGANALNKANKLLGRKQRRRQLLQRQKKILRYYRIIGVNKKVPTIGLLCGPQPIDTHMKVRQAKCDHHTIHWLYESGAEIVPILPWLKEFELDHILSKVHGVVFPGGKRKLMMQHSYELFAKVVFMKLKVNI